ncbi:MAG: cysteine hydrolase [Anaerolineales bacterium]|nr:cysteine hydrolase [Anaerolineales bacterium]
MCPTSQTPTAKARNQMALLVIDVQQGLFEKSAPIYQADQLLDNINLLVNQAHHAGVAVIYVQHSAKKMLVKGSREWQLHPAMQPQNIDILIHKQHGNAFEETALDEILKSRHITHLVITGLVTHGCVKATTLGARQLGYQATLVTDAHSSYSKKAAQIITETHVKLCDAGAILKSTEEIRFY